MCSVILFFGLLLTLILFNPVIKSKEAWICSLTGTMKYKTKWILTTPNKKVSTTALEKWIVKNKGQVNHRWVQVAGTHYSIQGTLFSHAKAPPIYFFKKECHFLT